METAIKTVNLTKAYRDIVAVDGVSLEVFEGECFALLGINGAGKTTTIKMLSCLAKPTSGEAYVCGFSTVKDSAAVRSRIGLSTQETAVAKNLTVKENMSFFGALYGLNKEEIEKRIEELESRFSLGEVMNKRVGKLSGGYQRKVSIALALISKPKVLFLDEPTLGLDVLSRRALWKTVEELKKNTTVILTTHYLEEAEALSDRVAIMSKGKIRAIGTPAALIRETECPNFEEAFIKIAGEGLE